MSGPVNCLEINEWLITTLGTSEIPKYETNMETLTILQSLMHFNQQRELDLQNTLKATKHLIDEVERKGKTLKDLFIQLKLGPNDFSPEIQSLLYTLVYSAMTLELNSPSETNFLLAFNDLKCEFMRLKKLNMAEEKLLEAMKMKTLDAVQDKNRLERILEKTETDCSEMRKETKRLGRKNTLVKSKSAEYKERLERLQRDFTKNGMTDELFHKNLKEKHAHLVKCKEDLGKLQKKLDGFFDLPPDIEITRAKIKQAENELESLKAKLSEKIDLVYS